MWLIFGMLNASLLLCFISCFDSLQYLLNILYRTNLHNFPGELNVATDNWLRFCICISHQVWKLKTQLICYWIWIIKQVAHLPWATLLSVAIKVWAEQTRLFCQAATVSAGPFVRTRQKRRATFAARLKNLVPHPARLSNFYRWLLKNTRLYRLVKGCLSRKSSIPYKINSLF